MVVDAVQCVAASGTVRIDKADQAALQLSDDPTSGAAQLTSLWENDLLAIKVGRMWGFELLGSAALITGWPAVTA